MPFRCSLNRPALISPGLWLVGLLAISSGVTVGNSTRLAMAIRQNPESLQSDRTKAVAVDELKARLHAEFANQLDDGQKAKIAAAFLQTHNGFSADEVILNDELQQRFLDVCKETLPELNAVNVNWALMNLRKAGKLSGITTTEQNRIDVAIFRPLAEIASRQLQDRYGVSTDQIMASPQLREQFDAAAQQVNNGADPYSVRKAAFQLRKTRLLKPELITRIADWGREITVRTADEFKLHPDSIPEAPGIYVFSDRTGYLYVGESDNLRRRLTEHLDESDRQSLASYLIQMGCENITLEIHTFEEGSRIGELAVRRAYESELIRSRNPRFNIRP